jgi:MFS family permease
MPPPCGPDLPAGPRRRSGGGGWHDRRHEGVLAWGAGRCGLSATPVAATAEAGAAPPRAARLAVFAQFVAHGLATALWVAHVPVVKARLGLDERDLGLALLALSAGAILAMQLAGPLIRHMGTRAGTRMSTVVLCASVVLPAYVGGLPALAGALAVLGLSIGMLDVTMNAQAAEVETRYGRPVMAAFHAWWSLAGTVGAVLSGLAIRAGWPMSRTTVVGAVVLGAGALVASRWLLPPEPRPDAAPAEVAGAAEAAAQAGVSLGPLRRRWAGRQRLPRVSWLLGALCFGSFLCEGAAGDWAGVHLREDLGVSAGVAAFGYGAFAGAMTAGRLVVDRVAGAVGGIPVLRYGGLLAVAGSLAVVFAPSPPLAFAGWALVGLGLSGVVPQLFSASANLPGGAATLARVASLGYLGTLSGPAVIGFVAQVTNLSAAFLLLTVLAAFVAAAANAGLRARE